LWKSGRKFVQPSKSFWIERWHFFRSLRFQLFWSNLGHCLMEWHLWGFYSYRLYRSIRYWQECIRFGICDKCFHRSSLGNQLYPYSNCHWRDGSGWCTVGRRNRPWKEWCMSKGWLRREFEGQGVGRLQKSGFESLNSYRYLNNKGTNLLLI